jgi:hypothetical protein
VATEINLQSRYPGGILTPKICPHLRVAQKYVAYLPLTLILQQTESTPDSVLTEGFNLTRGETARGERLINEAGCFRE